MHRFRELNIWQRAIKLAKPVYKVSELFPENEKFGLKAQIQRAVASISLNISEGSGRGTDKDFSRFLDMAIGSLNEVENCLFLGIELEYFAEKEIDHILVESQEILKMIIVFQQKLNRK